MKSFPFLILFAVLALFGCERKEHAGGAASQREQVGITFKGGKGLRISDETKKIIGLQVVEASEQKLAAEFTTKVQVYRVDGSGGEATGFVTDAEAKQLRAGQPVRLGDAVGVQGKLLRLIPLAQSGQVEVLIEVPKALDIGTTVEASFTAPEGQSVTAIPSAAVLRTAEGTFAYVVNGDYFFRTAVKTGAENAEFVEVKDGLYAGDQIVKEPVKTLWLAELQAIKGGADND